MQSLDSLLQNPIFSVVLVVVIFGWIIYRQLRPRKLHVRGLLIAPVIILYFLIRSFPSFHPTATEILDMIITSIVSLVFGLLACRSLKVYASPQTGKAMASGSWTYFLWWLASFVIKAGLAVFLGETSARSINTVQILIPVFLLVVTRNAYLYWRATSLGLQLHSGRHS